MFLIKSAVVIIQIDKTNTNIVDELKRVYDVCDDIVGDDSFPMTYKIADCHSLVFKFQDNNNDLLKYKLIIDGTKGLFCNGKFVNFSYYSKRNQQRKCRKCGKPGKLNKVLPLPTDKPTIIIHVKNNSQNTTDLKSEISSCLSVLVTLKDNIILQQTPIKQFVITITIKRDLMASTMKMVADGQTVYNGLENFEFFDNVENPLCLQCDPSELNHSDPDLFD
jgi:hypothetical protein